MIDNRAYFLMTVFWKRLRLTASTAYSCNLLLRPGAVPAASGAGGQVKEMPALQRRQGPVAVVQAVFLTDYLHLP